jgi:transposase-like protein
MELGINPKTVAKWRKRATVEDMKTGPTEPRSTVLTEAEEAMVVAFRRHTVGAAGRLPLCPATVDTAPDPVSSASLSTTTWHLAVA